MSSPVFKIFVHCDSSEHEGRRVAVTNFGASASGEWHEIPASRAGASPGSGLHLISDQPAQDGWALDPEVTGSDMRTNYDLRCRKCRASVSVRAETMPAVLDGWRTTGVDEVSLRMLAASMGRSKPR